jgi:hypothetical protein
MTPQPNLFESKEESFQFDENKDYLPELVGEGKKFRDQEALAKGKIQSDLYVKTLEQRLDEMRRDYEEARKASMTGDRINELIDRLNKGSTETNLNLEPKHENGENTTPSIKPEDVEGIVLKKIEESKRFEKEQANFNTVQAKLRERYGNNFTAVLEQQRQNLGLDAEDINALAKKSPVAFFKTLGLDQPQQDSFQSPPRSTIRNDNFLPNVEKRTWSWYQNVKKKDKALYYAPKTIAQMHRDHAELGREFEDGDYNAV